MSRDRHKNTITQTLQDVVSSHLALAQADGVPAASVADTAFTAFFAATPLHEIHFRCSPTTNRRGAELQQAMDTNRRSFYRWIHHESPMPADMLPHIINALPPPHHQNCVAELAEILGLAAQFRLPAPSVTEDFGGLARFMVTAGEAVERLAHVTAARQTDTMTPGLVTKACWSVERLCKLGEGILRDLRNGI